MRRKETPIGTRINLLVSLELPYKPEGAKRYRVKVVCDCGVIKDISEKHFVSGNVQSCGCVRDLKLVKRSTTHGMNYTAEHNSWQMMKQRCNDPNFKQFCDYGGRGISYDPNWESFENFYSDMGERPEGTTLDRIDVDGNYYKENCRWSFGAEQSHNRRKFNDKTSKFIGVCFSKQHNQWVSKISKNGVVTMKLFKNEIDAAKFYDDMSFIIYGNRPNSSLY